MTVTRAALPVGDHGRRRAVTIAGPEVMEGTAAATRTYTVGLDQAAPEARRPTRWAWTRRRRRRVALDVTESGAVLSGTPPASVTIAKGATSATLSVPTAADSVVEADSTVTARVTAGTGYSVGGAAAAAVTVLDDDTARLAVSAEPGTIGEGESATLTVAITNGVTFAEDLTFSLAVSGTASAADYTGVPEELTLEAGESAVTATLAATADQEEEGSETVTVTASRFGSVTGSATVTIESVSSDATLRALSLSGIDIGTFSGAATSYRASVANTVATTTVTAAARHAGATVAIAPGAEVSLAEGANRIRVTVTAEDGRTRKTYTVTVTREEDPTALPVVSIAALAGSVAEGEQARFRVTRTGSTSQPLDVLVSVATSVNSSVRSKTLRLEAGSRTSGIGYFRAQEDKVIWDEFTTTWTIQEGAGYAVSDNGGSATVVVQENDVAEFALTAEPAPVAEGSTATLTLAITNGVHFAASQAIALEVTGGTASLGADFTLSAATLTLRGSSSEVTATLEALDDDARESDETVTLTARRGGAAIATREVAIANRDLTAELLGVPRAHDGATAFGFELRFSKQPAIGHQALRESAFEVTGGSVTGARRLVADSSLRWEITVQPASEAEVALTLPVPASCAAEGAICTAGGGKLAQAVTARVAGPGAEPAGFPLAPENSSPSGIWSDGETAWVADLEDARLYAYQRSDGERQPGKDIVTEPAPMGLWSDGDTIWVAGLDGGLRAHRLANGARLVRRDLALEASEAPAGVWSDGETAWVSAWLGDAVHAYRLADGERVASRDIKLSGENLMPVGLWSDGETLWVADWRERLYAYRLSDGGRDPRRDIEAGIRDTDPTGLWSDGGTLLSTGWEGGQVRAYLLPEAVAGATVKKPVNGPFARAASLPAIADPALRDAIGAALGKAPGEAASPQELAGLEALTARNAGIRNLSGLEQAVSLKELDLGFNQLTDLSPLATLPALESLNLDGASTDLRALAPLMHLQRLSVRHNGLDDLWPLAGLTLLAELDVGDNRISDLQPLAGLGGLAVLRADRNRIADLWPLASLVGLEALDLGANRVQNLQPLSGLARLQTLQLDGNGLAELQPLAGLEALRDLGLAGNAVEDLQALSDLDGLRRLDMRGNPVGNLRPVRALESLAWIHVGGSRIEDLGPLNGLSGLTVAGREDRERPTVDGGSGGSARQR